MINQIMQGLNMGGYAIYIWSAYGLVCFVLITVMISIYWQKRQMRKQLLQWFKNESRA